MHSVKHLASSVASKKLLFYMTLLPNIARNSIPMFESAHIWIFHWVSKFNGALACFMCMITRMSVILAIPLTLLLVQGRLMGRFWKHYCPA
ncbi:hypothetical protein ID866_12629 [Astraeus odoratus]|nr:hypothetical protein ID866_12629 [Astraeus odoratus]